VGTFKADGDILESQLIGDANTLLPALGRKAYNSVIADLASPGAFASFRHALTLNPAFKVTVERQSDYYARGTKTFSDFFHAVAYMLGGLMAIGAVFGTVNTLYSAVSARSREIATLRALGFSAVAVASSVILEALFLSLIGAITGAAIAWMLFDGHQKVLGSSVFSLSVTLSLAGIGIIWAVAIALIGAVLPSIRAARTEIAVALGAV
jgi:putative ABC transport system permease protein